MSNKPKHPMTDLHDTLLDQLHVLADRENTAGAELETEIKRADAMQKLAGRMVDNAPARPGRREAPGEARGTARGRPARAAAAGHVARRRARARGPASPPVVRKPPGCGPVIFIGTAAWCLGQLLGFWWGQLIAVGSGFAALWVFAPEEEE